MVVHKMVVSIMDNGQMEVLGIPSNLESALFLIHNLTRVVVEYHLDRAIKQRALLQFQRHEPESVLMN